VPWEQLAKAGDRDDLGSAVSGPSVAIVGELGALLDRVARVIAAELEVLARLQLEEHGVAGEHRTKLELAHGSSSIS
jgi:hypothetical protein